MRIALGFGHPRPLLTGDNGICRNARVVPDADRPADPALGQRDDRGKRRDILRHFITRARDLVFVYYQARAGLACFGFGQIDDLPGRDPSRAINFEPPEPFELFRTAPPPTADSDNNSGRDEDRSGGSRERHREPYRRIQRKFTALKEMPRVLRTGRVR